MSLVVIHIVTATCESPSFYNAICIIGKTSLTMLKIDIPEGEQEKIKYVRNFFAALHAARVAKYKRAL